MGKFLILLVGLGLVAAKPQFGKDLGLTEGRIIGGEEAPKHEFPWQVSLKSLGSHICGGSIVNRNQVITAAHCCEGQLALFDRIIPGLTTGTWRPAIRAGASKVWSTTKAGTTPPLITTFAS